MRGRRRRALAAFLIGLIPGMVGILCLRWPLAASVETAALDLLFVMRGEREPYVPVRVVGIDNISYAELDLSDLEPWPRLLHADLIDTLAEEGAAAITFDVVFQNPGEAAETRRLADAIAAAGNVVLGMEINRTSDRRGTMVERVEPYAPLASSAAALGVVGFPEDRDSVIRHAWLRFDDRPSLALAAARIASGGRLTSDEAAALIDYYGPARTIPTVSFYQALNPREHLPAGFFRDAIVFVGLSRPAAAGDARKDLFPTPFHGGSYPATYGVEIHATIAANLLEGRRLGLLPRSIEVVLILLVPLLATFIFMYLRPLAGAAAFVPLLIAPWIAGTIAFNFAHVWIPVMIPFAIQVPSAYGLSLLWYYLTTARERERIRRAFSFYLSPDMIERIVADPSRLNLGGEEIVGTCLFTDVKGFTTLAEVMPAKKIAALLNEYFSEVNRHIFRERGTLIKFIGDAVFAIWGAPVRIEDHATPACAAALALARAQERGTGAPETALSRLTTRIGVNTGLMVVGNLGSAQRFDYTAVGDAVNVAARLEGLNKQMGTLVIASGVTIQQTGDRFAVRRLGRVRVAGKQEPIEIFEILGLRGEATRPDARAVARFEEALHEFAARRFTEAVAGFEEVRAMCGGRDGPSEQYLATIERLTAEPLPDDWDATVVFATK